MNYKEVTCFQLASPKNVLEVNRRGIDGSQTATSCQLAIAEYNRIMGDVDRFDQLWELLAYDL
jgi:hypothetical protein